MMNKELVANESEGLTKLFLRMIAIFEEFDARQS
jgi:hypothetical protein